MQMLQGADMIYGGETKKIWISYWHPVKNGIHLYSIYKHIKNIFEEGELIESQVMKKFGNSEFTGNLTKLTNF